MVHLVRLEVFEVSQNDGERVGGSVLHNICAENALSLHELPNSFEIRDFGAPPYGILGPP